MNSENKSTEQNSSSNESLGPRTRPSDRPLGWIWLLPVIAILGFMFLNRKPNFDNTAIGKPAPKIELVRLSTSPQSGDLVQNPLDRIPNGNVTLVHFWGTWCGPCRMEYPHLSEMVERLSSSPGFRLLSISCESGSNETFLGLAEKTEDYLTQIGASTEVYADPNGTTRRSAAERLGQQAMYFPTSILIDREGIIRQVWQGYGANAVNEMEAAVKELL